MRTTFVLLLLAILVPSVLHASRSDLRPQQQQQQQLQQQQQQQQRNRHRHSNRELVRKIHNVPDLIPSKITSENIENENMNINKEEKGPYINRAMSADVVGVLGKEVRLNCHVTNLGNKTISWMRLRDLRLLTVGRYAYTPDRRFSPLHIPLTHFWQLRIAEVKRSDEGYYECQVSTTPPRGHQIKLTVVEPHTEILGGPDMHVDWGSTINLTCVARFSPAPPPDVEWYHNNKVISYDSPRGGVSLVIEKGEWTTSHLLIQRATPADSGEYRCMPKNTVEASINLHILQGKNPDAWHSSGATALAPNLQFQLNLLPNLLLHPVIVLLILATEIYCQTISTKHLLL